MKNPYCKAGVNRKAARLRGITSSGNLYNDLRNLESIQAARALKPPGNPALRRVESAGLPQHYGPVLGRNFPLDEPRKR
jgi:hypothetical protein